MHDNSAGGDDGLHTDPVEPETRDMPAGGLSAADYCRLAEECMSLAAVSKDPEKAAELVKTGDDHLRHAAQLIADQLKDH
jgi:hypothetical protein